VNHLDRLTIAVCQHGKGGQPTIQTNYVILGRRRNYRSIYVKRRSFHIEADAPTTGLAERDSREQDFGSPVPKHAASLSRAFSNGYLAKLRQTN
jgi:hypothetical protein